MKRVKLKEICDLKNGFAFKSQDYVEYSDTLSCRMSNIRPGGYFDLEYNPRFLPTGYQEKYRDYLLKDGDIVIAMTDLANDPKILGVPTIVKTGGRKVLLNQRVGKLVIKDPTLIDVPYLQHALNRPQNKSYYKKFAGGGLQINVGKKEILNNEIPLPPLETQQKIAAILDEADRLRRLNKELIATYEQLGQSLFLGMFGDPVSNLKKLKNYNLGSVCRLITDGTHHSPEPQSEGYPYVTAKHVKPFRLEFTKKATYISKEAHEAIYKRCAPVYGDVLYIKDGATTGIACLNSFKEPISLLSSLALIKPNQELLDPIYLCFWLNNEGIKSNLIAEFMSGAAIKRYTLKKINAFPIVLPDIIRQRKFAKNINELEKQKLHAQQALEHSEALFNSLLQKAFKGELV